MEDIEIARNAKLKNISEITKKNKYSRKLCRNVWKI